MIKRALLGVIVSTLPLVAHGAEIDKSDWMNQMVKVLPATFCKPEQYFRQCFKVTAKECEEMATSVTKSCLDKYRDKIPDVMVQPRDGGRWGGVVGGCAGGAYENNLWSKRINNEKCNDVNNWR